MINRFEIGILDRIHCLLSCRALDFFFRYFTNVGSTVFMIALTALLLIFRKTRKMGVTAAIALILGVLIANLIIKNFVARPRPYEIVNIVNLLIVRTNDYSFPSGHALACFEVAISVLFYNKKYGIISCVLAGIVAFSRLYLYAHYPSDVLAGIILAVITSFAARFIAEKVIKKYPKLF